jgi:hypothetical protein
MEKYKYFLLITQNEAQRLQTGFPRQPHTYPHMFMAFYCGTRYPDYSILVHLSPTLELCPFLCIDTTVYLHGFHIYLPIYLAKHFKYTLTRPQLSSGAEVSTEISLQM